MFKVSAGALDICSVLRRSCTKFQESYFPGSFKNIKDLETLTCFTVQGHFRYFILNKSDSAGEKMRLLPTIHMCINSSRFYNILQNTGRIFLSGCFFFNSGNGDFSIQIEARISLVLYLQVSAVYYHHRTIFFLFFFTQHSMWIYLILSHSVPISKKQHCLKTGIPLRGVILK